MRTAELVCSPGLETAVRAVWQRLVAAGLPSLARNIHPTNRPHLTLAAVDEFPPGAAYRLAELFDAALPVPHLSLALRFRDADLRVARAVAGGQRPTGEFSAARSYDGTNRTVTPLTRLR